MLQCPHRARLAPWRLPDRHQQPSSGRTLGAAALHSKVMFCLLRAETWQEVVCILHSQAAAAAPVPTMLCSCAREALLQHSQATMRLEAECSRPLVPMLQAAKFTPVGTPWQGCLPASWRGTWPAS